MQPDQKRINKMNELELIREYEILLNKYHRTQIITDVIRTFEIGRRLAIIEYTKRTQKN